MNEGLQAVRTDMDESAPDVVRTEGLTKRYADVTAVDEVSIGVRAGEIFGLIGPNGAGKSTMIKILTTLLPATAGHATVAGADVRTEPGRVRQRIGYVPQVVSADGSLTAAENLWVSARLYNIARAEQGDRIREALDVVGLKDAANTLVRRFSGGMVRRLEIAQSLLHRPTVLFMDEPTVGLDPVAHRAIWEDIEDLRNRYGMTILITTHDMAEADAHCDRVGVMHLGKIVATGTPAELKAQVGPNATLDDVFSAFTGSQIMAGGNYREILRTRRTARRLS
jgi:ABC-2 type transport system ATP-binding protein